MMAQRTAVIGGGMAGTAAARELSRAGREVVVLEAADGLGGRARSWHRPEIEPDVGVNLWFTSFYKVLFERIREYGLEGDLVEMSNNVIIVHEGRPAEITSDSIKTLFTYPHVSRSDRLRFLVATMRETLRRGKLDMFEPEQLAAFDNGAIAADWARRRVSQRGLDNLIRPEIESFWLWRLEEISAAHLMASQANLVGARFYVFRQGMEVVAERMAADAEVRTGCEVTDLARSGGGTQVTWRDPYGESTSERFADVVIATPAPITAKLIAALPDEVVAPATRRFVETQRYEPAISVSYLVERSSMPSEAHIVSTGDREHAVRTIITFPRRLVRDGRDMHVAFVYPGRRETADLLNAPDDQVFERVKQIVPSLWPDFPHHAEPFVIARRPHAMPWPEPGRFRRSAHIATSQRGPVTLAGDYFCSPTAEAAMRSGIRAAQALLGAAA
jgi:protoporphyrinogen/coproporphyrinogen III oxidase